MTKPTVYVAARFGQYERARALIDVARDRGYEIAFDWTRTPEFGADGHPLPRANAKHGAELPDSAQKKYAWADLDGVRRSELVILLGDPGLWGALIEAGAALAAGKDLWIVGEIRWSVFWSLPSVQFFDSDAEVCNRLSNGSWG